MDDLSVVLTRLETRLETLEGRVSSLERPGESPAVLPAPATPFLDIGSPQSGESSSFAEAGATFPVVGKAMLGLAGAYLLRAVAESGSLPKLAVIALAIAYAAMWLMFAVLVPARAWFASTTYAGTSALILAPMLWELTLRFRFMSPSIAAAALAAFVVAAYALAWKRDLTSVVWVADVAAAATAIGLLIATHHVVPFLAVLLLMALLNEVAAAGNHWLSVRPIVAAAADIAIGAVILAYATPEASRPEYAALSPGILLAPAAVLLLLYGTSIALRTTLSRHKISFFEAAQAMTAFLLAASAVGHFGSTAAAIGFGVFCLVLSPACYAAAFLLFDRVSERRNYQVYAAWGLALCLSGSFLCLPIHWLASGLGMAALLTTFLGLHRSRLTLEFHGLAYLAAAAYVSGLLQYAAHALAGAFPSPPTETAWIVCGAAILCYAIAWHFDGSHWKPRLFQTLSATLAAGAAATALVSALVWITSTIITPGTSHVAVIRTLTACVLALTLAFFGPRWRRTELVWVTYATLALVAAKLLLEDLQQGHPEFIAASIFLYAVTLILVPQVVRRSAKRAA